jgi:hypothetical protein
MLTKSQQACAEADMQMANTAGHSALNSNDQVSRPILRLCAFSLSQSLTAEQHRPLMTWISVWRIPPPETPMTIR